jgi:hypothetical protein
MHHDTTWLAAGALLLTAVLVLAVLALARSDQIDGRERLVLGVPTGELLVSLLSVGLVAALTFTDALDVRVAGTLLGVHAGYHAAAAKRR